jgi:hypothetical protein
MTPSLEDKQSQLETDHLPSSGWEVKVARSCVLSPICLCAYVACCFSD